MSKTIFITGASSGIGRATAELFAEKGWNVVATMRSPEKGQDLAAHDGIDVLRLDVTDEASIRQSVAEAIEKFGRIDVLLNNAGYGTIGVAEFADRQETRRLYETLVIGLIEVTKAVLPNMRANRSGVVINVSSVGGRITFPLMSLYHGAKWAVEGFSEALNFELAPLGIQVKILEPGAIGTRFLGNIYSHLGDEQSDYAPTVQKMMARIEAMGGNMSTSESVAEVVYEAATDGSDQLRYAAGPDAVHLLKQRAEVGDEAFVKGMRLQMLGEAVESIPQ